MDEEAKISKLAVSSLIISIVLFPLLLLSGLLAIILGLAALNCIAKHKGLLTGRGFATAGIVIGVAQIIFILVISLLAAILFFFWKADYRLAEIYAHMGRNREAIALYEKEIGKLKLMNNLRVRENEFMLYNNLGVAYQGLGDSMNAMNAYNQALQTAKKEMALALYGIASVSVDAKNYDPAVKLLDEAIDLNPEFVLAYQEKASALRYLGRYEDSAAACRTTIKLFPKFAQAHSTLGLAYEKLGQYDAATGEHIAAIRLNPKRYFPRDRLYYCFRQIHNKALQEELLGDLKKVDSVLAADIKSKLDSGEAIAPNSFDELNKEPRRRF